MVNGRRVNMPSFVCRPGDVVEVAEKAKNQLRIKGAAEAAESRGHPEWLEVDAKALKGKFKAQAAADASCRPPSTSRSWSSSTRSNFRMQAVSPPEWNGPGFRDLRGVSLIS